jgi:hypothetical protein
LENIMREQVTVPRFVLWRRAPACIACLLTTLLPVHSAAQDRSRIWPFLDASKLPELQVLDATGAETRGRLLSIDSSSLVLLVDGVERRFDARDVRRIDRRGDSLRNGAVIGATLGIVVGALGAGMSDCPQGRIDAGCPGLRVAMFLTNVALWTSGGTALDAAIQGTTTIYPAQGRSDAARPAPRSRPSLRLTLRW